MTTNWDGYTRQGLDLATTATSLGFSAVKRGTRFGFRIARGITDTAVGVTSTVVDHALFGGSTVVRSVADSVVDSFFTVAEQLALAPIHFSEYITSTSFIAAHSSINVLSVIFPGSSEASFSLVSFITLVRREWSDRDGVLPKKNYGLTQVARAIVAWVALQGVTQEWGETRWFEYLKELDVKEKDERSDHPPPPGPRLLSRRNSRIRVTSDIIFPGEGGPQIISADIGESPLSTPSGLPNHSRTSTISSLSSLSSLSMHPINNYTPTSPNLSRTPSFQPISRTPSYLTLTSSASSIYSHPHSRSRSHSLQQPIFPFPTAHTCEQQEVPLSELKLTLRRLSKMVLAGYGGASLLFFGVTPYGKSTNRKGEAREKREEEDKLANAINAAEAEAEGVETNVPPQPKYSWWDQLLGKHDQEIFLRSVESDEEENSIRNRNHRKEKEKANAANNTREKMKSYAKIGSEHLLPRFWVLTDHGRGEIVLVLRGTMSLNEIAVDLTCESEGFEPGQTQDLDIDEEDSIPGMFTSSREKQEPESGDNDKRRKKPRYHVHSGMLRMAKAMGDVGKPVQLAVQEALYHNPGFDLVLCGHSLGAGVAALLGLMWADPATCLTVRSSGLPIGRRLSVYCFAPPALSDANLSRLAKNLVTSFVYSNDVVARLSLGSVRDLRNAALWLCEAEEGKHSYDEKFGGGRLREDGWSAVIKRAKTWKEGKGMRGDMEWFIAVRKTLEANMQNQDMFPPGRVLWAMRNSELHPKHQTHSHHDRQHRRTVQDDKDKDKDKLRLFEVLDVEKVFGQLLFARNMLTAHMPHQYDRALHDLL